MLIISSMDRNTVWEQSSFRNFIRNTYPESTVSESAVQLLWRAFNLYARHPFPCTVLQPQNITITFAQFQRGVLLTAYQFDSLLGTRELDWYWREEVQFFRHAGIARMFASVAKPVVTEPETTEQRNEGFAAAVSDAMDVLVMLGPQYINAVPSPEQLEPIAQRLCRQEGRQSATVRRQMVERDQLALLVDLLLRLHLGQQSWGPGRYFGFIVENSSSDDVARSEALLDYLAGSGNGQKAAVEQMSSAAMYHLVSVKCALKLSLEKCADHI
jgi:hypothetical protein